MRYINIFLQFIFVIIVTATAPVLADEIDDILAGETAPPGIVFEIVSGDHDLLRDLLPAIQNNIHRLLVKGGAHGVHAVVDNGLAVLPILFLG